MTESVEEAVQRVQHGIKGFVDEMREKGIHVGIGTAGVAICAVCREDWPCAASKDGAT